MCRHHQVDLSTEFREGRRKELYGHNRHNDPKKFKVLTTADHISHEFYSSFSNDKKLSEFESSSKSDYTPKIGKVNENRGLRQNAATYGKASHIKLGNDNCSSYLTTTKIDYAQLGNMQLDLPLKPKDQPRTHQVIYRDERNIALPSSSLYKQNFSLFPFQNFAPPSTTVAKQLGTSTNFKLGSENNGANKWVSVTKNEIVAMKPEPVAVYERLDKQKKNVLDWPDGEKGDWRSTQRSDFNLFLNSEDRKKLTVDSNGFKSDLKSTHFSFGGSSVPTTSTFESQYTSSFQQCRNTLKAQLEETIRHGRHWPDKFADNIHLSGETGKLEGRGTSREAYVAHAADMNATIQALNNKAYKKSRISFYMDDEFTNRTTSETNMEFRNRFSSIGERCGTNTTNNKVNPERKLRSLILEEIENDANDETGENAKLSEMKSSYKLVPNSVLSDAYNSHTHFRMENNKDHRNCHFQLSFSSPQNNLSSISSSSTTNSEYGTPKPIGAISSCTSAIINNPQPIKLQRFECTHYNITQYPEEKQSWETSSKVAFTAHAADGFGMTARSKSAGIKSKRAEEGKILYRNADDEENEMKYYVSTMRGSYLPPEVVKD